jgi:hypothetical protein
MGVIIMRYGISGCFGFSNFIAFDFAPGLLGWIEVTGF